jgi:predicted O-methyltransferase YrrM
MLKKIYRFLSPKFQTLAMEYKVNFKPRYGHGLPSHKGLQTIINENRADYAEILHKIVAVSEAFYTIKNAKDELNPLKPTWNNGFLPGLDIMVLYTMLGIKGSLNYIEIGSGNSTKVVAKAIEDFKLPTKITSIDPYPRAEIDTLAQKIIREPFENIDFSFIFNLEPNDILFIDNSHRVLPNSDAMVFFMEVLPMLPKGVIVHIHDIYLPYDYPQFMCDRFYSEQYNLAAFIMANPKRYRTIMPNYFVSEDKELSEILAPVWKHPNLQDVEKHGGSYWLQIGE